MDDAVGRLPRRRERTKPWSSTSAARHDARKSPIDHEHYVTKQLRAVAEPVLALLGKDFATIAGHARQLSLF